MPWKTKVLCMFFIIFPIILLISCHGKSSTFKDGYYTAEEAIFDIYGWKEYLSISVSGGKIILGEYDAYTPSGFIKSWDIDYMRQMNAENGTYPNEYTRYYISQFLESQGTANIDALSGATHSYSIFLRLAEAVLINAREGNSKTTRVDINEETEENADEVTL